MKAKSLARSARLTLPRDLQVCYLIGRLGLVKVSDVWRIFWGSPHTARAGFGRLERLGLIRSFDRVAPSLPKWFSLSPRGIAFVLEESDCDEKELRIYSGISRLNLEALAVRNRFWSSLIIASKASSRGKLHLFRAEQELREVALGKYPVVPDALVVLAPQGSSPGDDSGISQMGHAFLIELDSGSERLAVWEKKARSYAELRRSGPLFGEASWSLVALVPSRRRLQAVAASAVKGGAGAFTYLAEASVLEEGRAFERVLSRALEVTPAAPAPSLYSLVDVVDERSSRLAQPAGARRQ